MNEVATKERPILFSGDMVRAILAGKKTQTRRVVNPPPYRGAALIGPTMYTPTVIRRGEETAGEPVFGIYDLEGEYGCKCPFGQPGDRLWVREKFMPDPIYREFSLQGYIYAATDEAPNVPLDLRWRPSIHMPRAASRITLVVTNVRVERLQSISGADALAEGSWMRHQDYEPDTTTALHNFEAAWLELYGNWCDNPWVWVVKFEIAKGDVK